MKLRILGDSLRLRLSQSEVEQMRREGRVEDAIQFGPGGVRLVYALVADASVEGVQALFKGEAITVSVPTGDVRSWVGSEQVGLSADHGNLRILIEKDFKCLVPRDGVEDSDGFPNPSSR